MHRRAAPLEAADLVAVEATQCIDHRSTGGTAQRGTGQGCRLGRRRGLVSPQHLSIRLIVVSRRKGRFGTGAGQRLQIGRRVGRFLGVETQVRHARARAVA